MSSARRSIAGGPSRPRWATAIATIIAIAILAMITFSLWSLVAPDPEPLPDRPTVPLAMAATSILVSFTLVGFVIVWQRPENPIGWLFLVVGLAFAVNYVSIEYVWRAILFDLPLPAVHLVGWLGDWSSQVAIGLAFTWLPLLFPNGLLPGARWRAVFWLSGAVILLGVAAAAVRPAPILSFDGSIRSPIVAPESAADLIAAIEALYTPLLLGSGGLALASLLIRFRRGGVIERQQLKWFGLATGTFIVSITAGIITLVEPLFTVALFAGAAIPVSCGIAILRYRLYEIDRLISRTVSWALVTGVLVAVFAGLVVGLQAVLADVTQGQTLAVAASTLVAFALFQPVRGRVQRAVDRRFDRARYDGERTAAAFAERLRDQMDMTGLEADIAWTVGTVLRPSAVGVWTRRRGQEGR